MADTTHEPGIVYRDATFSKEARDYLEQAAKALEENVPVGLPPADFGTLAEYVRDVVERWDANEATEILVFPGGIRS